MKRLDRWYVRDERQEKKKRRNRREREYEDVTPIPPSHYTYHKNSVLCPNCGRHKMLFGSEGAALRFIEFNADDIEARTGTAPRYAYYCDLCCGWHLSSTYYESPKKTRLRRSIDKHIREKRLKEERKMTWVDLMCYSIKREREYIKYIRNGHDVLLQHLKDGIISRAKSLSKMRNADKEAINEFLVLHRKVLNLELGEHTPRELNNLSDKLRDLRQRVKENNPKQTKPKKKFNYANARRTRRGEEESD